MKEKSTYQLIDEAMLQMLCTWAEINDRMEEAALRIPHDAFEIEDETGEVFFELMATRQLETMADGVMESARKLVSSAQDAGLISLDDCHTINHILWFVGTGEPLEDVL